MEIMETVSSRRRFVGIHASYISENLESHVHDVQNGDLILECKELCKEDNETW